MKRIIAEGLTYLPLIVFAVGTGWFLPWMQWLGVGLLIPGVIAWLFLSRS